MNTKKLLALFLSLLMLLTVVTTATLAEDNDPFEDDKWGVTPTEVTTPTDVPEESSSSETEVTTPSSSETESSSSETTPSSSETTEPSSSETEVTTPSSSVTTVPSSSTTEPTASTTEPTTSTTEPTTSTTEPTASTTEPTVSTTLPTQSTTEPTKNTTSALDPSNPDNEPIPDDTEPTQKPTITVKNAAGVVIGKTNKFFVGNLKNGKKEYVFNYSLSNSGAKVVWESTNTAKIKVISNNGKQVKIKIVCKNPAKNFNGYVAVNCKYEGEVIFTLNLTYIQLNDVKNIKTVGNKLSWGDVDFATGYVVYDLTTKKEKVIKKTSFKAIPGHSYQVQALEDSLGMKYYSTKSAKVFCLKTPNVKLTAGKKLIKVTAKKVKNADRFQVRYRIKGKWITKTFKTTKALNKKIAKLKKGKTYSVQVRVCKNKNSFSNWTKIKKVKVK